MEKMNSASDEPIEQITDDLGFYTTDDVRHYPVVPSDMDYFQGAYGIGNEQYPSAPVPLSLRQPDSHVPAEEPRKYTEGVYE